MSDEEDADLENLRQLALSSLLKKKSVPLQTNAELDEEGNSQDGDDGIEDGGDDDDGSSSGSEYAVIEEGLSVSSGDVDQVIEEIIVSGEEGNGSEEDEAEDAVSIASHDSFDEILNSVEEEIRGSKRRPSTAGGDNATASSANGPSDSKRLRPDVVQVERKDQSKGDTDRRVRARSPAFRDSYQKEYDKPRQGSNRKPGSPNYHRNRRSKSPRNLYRHRSPLLPRRTSKSPTENKKPNSTNYPRRKSPSPILLRRNDGDGIGGRDYQRQVRRRPGGSRNQTGSDNDKPRSHQLEEVRRQYNSNRRRSAERRRSRSPPNRLSFGDHRLRTRARPTNNNKPSSRNPSRQSSRERTRSPGGKRQERTTKSPERKQITVPPIKPRSPSPAVDISNLGPEERMRLEKRKLKFQSKASGSGKVILKPKESSENHAKKVPKVPITFTDSSQKSEGSRRKASTTNSSPIASRLGQVPTLLGKGVERQPQRPRHDDRPKSKAVTVKSKDSRSRRDVEDFSNNNSKRASGASSSTSPPKTVAEDDLRTKLQQKRANANVGRIFTVALKDTIHKDTSVSPRH